MANESVTVSGPVEVQSASKQSVALKLMQHISSWEDAPDVQKKDRKYWLTLYRQCYKAANGSSLESVLKAD